MIKRKTFFVSKIYLVENKVDSKDVSNYTFYERKRRENNLLSHVLFFFVYLSLFLRRALVAIVAGIKSKGKLCDLRRNNGRNYDVRRPPSGIKGGQARATEKRYRLIAGTDCLLRNVCMPISRDLWRVVLLANASHIATKVIMLDRNDTTLPNIVEIFVGWQNRK